MPADAPITQDLLTIPRKMPEGALPNAIGLRREALAAELARIGTPDRQIKMRVGQIWQSIYHKGATSFEDLTPPAKEDRTQLAENFTLDRPEVVLRQVSTDGTRK